MAGYPTTLAEFETMFATEASCREYLVKLRWPDGFLCPRCGARKAWSVNTGRLECAGCSYQVSVTAGTVFHRSHLPLTVWFRAMWWMSSQKQGASALGLQRVLGIGSYKTAWLLLHKLRRAMVRPDRDRLTGRVEVDETYLGAPEPGRHGRRIGHKALVAIAAEENGKGIGRIRMRRIPNGKAESLHPFIEASIEPGSVIHTDAWQGYAGITKKGYWHDVTELANTSGTAAQLMPRVHRVASLLKRWLLGTHQGAISHSHLDQYLNEFTFRFNRRSSHHRGHLFLRLIQQAAAVSPSTYNQIVAGGIDSQPQQVGVT